MKKYLIQFLTLSVGFLSVNIAAFAGDLEVSVTPSKNVKQGQTVFIEINTKKELKNPVFYYRNKKYKIFKTKDGKYAGLLGIPLLQKGGNYKIVIKDNSGLLNTSKNINVVSTEYPIQNLVLNKKMSGLTASNRELNQIGMAKRKLTPVSMRTAPPYDSPTKGCIISVFGLKRHYDGKFSGNYHKGVDIAAPTGEPIKTITDGKVIIAEDFRLHGTAVAVDHGHGLMSLYLHLSKMDVKVGDYVKAGQKIGEVGQTGFATGPHLHWGLYVNGTPVDPMKGWIKPVSLCK